MHVGTFRLEELTVDPGIQARAAIDPAAVEEYAESYRQGVKLPPLVAFDDCHQIWLAGGFHRYEAAKLAGLTEIEVEVDEGSRDTAILYAVGDNADHGVRRTPADKRRAVETLLARPGWGEWSDREIAERCHVSHTFVAKVRKNLTGNVASEDGRERTYTTRHGTEATMNVGGIGQKRTGDAPPADDEPGGSDSTWPPATATAASEPGSAPANEGGTPVDGIGLAVPERLRPVFEAAGRFREAVKAMQAMQRTLNGLATGPGGRVLRRGLQMRTGDSFRCTDLHNSRLGLANAVPFVAECPDCHAIHSGRYATDCKACGGEAWVTEDTWLRTLPERQAAVLVKTTAATAA
jgi:hypothetical protein